VIAVLSVRAARAETPAKNVVLFIGDGAGISSLNAASIYGYGRAQALLSPADAQPRAGRFFDCEGNG